MSVTSWVCVGQGSAPQGVCQSGNSTTWFNQTVSFSTQNDTLVTSNTVIWDGTQFVAAANGVVITSPDGTHWTSGSVLDNAANVVTFDPVNGLYYVGCVDGIVLKSPTIAGLATATPKPISANNLRCAASTGGITLMGDDGGGMFSTSNAGVTWVSETTGLGAAVLCSLSANL